MPARPAAVSLEAAEQRKLAVDLFNHAWTLLEKENRSERETDLMVAAAHASRFFWEEIGEPVNHARGDWQLARVYATAGRPEPALHHAGRCLAICTEHAIGDFDLAYAHEALARAHALAGRRADAVRHDGLARAAAQQISDAEDRDALLADLATLPETEAVQPARGSGSGVRTCSIRSRRGSKRGGRMTFVPNSSSGRSTAKPGPSSAIS
jgi:hypothetical protein